LFSESFEATPMSISKLCLVLLIFLICLSTFISTSSSSSSKEEAAAAIRDAEEVLVDAYQTVSATESAGANASSLFDELDVAGNFLAQANISYRTGDFNSAVSFARNSLQVGSQIYIEASRLKSLAETKANQYLLYSTIWSIVGVGVVTVLSLLGWRAFKRYYYKRVLKMRPEVLLDESK